MIGACEGLPCSCGVALLGLAFLSDIGVAQSIVNELGGAVFPFCLIMLHDRAAVLLQV